GGSLRTGPANATVQESLGDAAGQLSTAEGLGAGFREHSVEEQDDDPATDGQQHAPDVEPRDVSEAEQGADKAAHDRPHDPEHERDDAPSGRLPRPQIPRQEAGYEPKHDPRDDPHPSPLSAFVHPPVQTPPIAECHFACRYCRYSAPSAIKPECLGSSAR